MHIVLVTETLVTGGAETFVLRLASALQKHGNNVALYVLRCDKVDPVLVRSIAPNASMEVAHIPYLKLILKLDSIIFRLGIGMSLLRWLQVRCLRGYLSSVQPDIVHSHLLTSDLVTASACHSLNIPWVTTMHGDYLAYENKGPIRAARIRDFGRALSNVEKSVGHMVCITDQQMQQLSRLLPRLASKGNISKIYNGYVASGVVMNNDIPVSMAQIPTDAFVIGMVSRGLRDKGWEVLIAAFLELQLPNSWLVLVGDGDYLLEVRSTIKDKHIIFAGNVVDPLRYIARFDVGCLPSRYKTESLPTVVIEYLYLGKPVVATDVGEIPRMIDAEGDSPAGLLIDLAEPNVMAEQMKIALKMLYESKAKRHQLSENAALAVHKFDMETCANAYVSVYESVQ